MAVIFATYISRPVILEFRASQLTTLLCLISIVTVTAATITARTTAIVMHAHRAQKGFASHGPWRCEHCSLSGPGSRVPVTLGLFWRNGSNGPYRFTIVECGGFWQYLCPQGESFFLYRSMSCSVEAAVEPAAKPFFHSTNRYSGREPSFYFYPKP